MPIRLALASREPILLLGLERLFEAEPDIEVSSVRAGAREAVAAAAAERPDVLLLDTSLTEDGDRAALRELAALRPCPPIVLLVGAVEPDELIDALGLGVRGVLVRWMEPRLFVECVRKVARGERWVELRSEALALDHLVRRDAAMRELSGRLTAREMEIVPLVAAGLSNKEIGARLAISHSTVKVHLQNVFRKVGVEGRIALLRWAEERGLYRQVRRQP